MAVLFSDDFNRANESLDASADWTERKGNYELVSNMATLSGVGAWGPALVAHCNSSDITTADYSVQADCNRNGASSWMGVAGRRVDYSTDDSDLYCVIGSSTDGEWRLYKQVSATWTQLDSYAATIADATFYTVKLEMNGTTIKGYIDGTERLSATDSSLSASGDAGISNYESGVGTGYQFDNFTADTLAAGGATGKSNPLFGPLGGPLAGAIGI